MDSDTRYARLLNHFDLRYEIDHKTLKLLLIWFWRHVKVHQYDQTGPLNIWATITMECDIEAKQIKNKTRKQDS